jgi:hypothetical protein
MNEELRAKLCQTRDRGSKMSSLMADERDQLERGRKITETELNRLHEEHNKIKGNLDKCILLLFSVMFQTKQANV